MTKKKETFFGQQEYEEIRDNLIKKGKAREAQEKFEKILEKDAFNAHALHGKAYALDVQGRSEEALSIYESAIKRHPEEPYLWHGRGVIQASMNNHQQALENYDQAIELDPGYSVSMYGKGNTYRNLEKPEEALEAYNRALEVDPEFVEALHNRGNVLKSMGRNEEALADFERAIQLSPKKAFSWNGKGVTLKNLERYEEALAAYNKAIEIDPKLTSPYYNRGILYEKIEGDRSENALFNYRKVIEMNPNSVRAHYNIGSILEKQEKFDEAISVFKQLAALENASEFQQERTLEIIKELEARKSSEELNEVSKLVEKIEQLLRFEGENITHYTNFAVAQFLLLQDQPSPLWATEASYMNDPSEGKALFEYLEKDRILGLKDEGVTLPFVKKPFMACFVPNDKYDDLNLWRFYGNDASGCSITVDQKAFSRSIVEAIQSKIAEKGQETNPSKSGPMKDGESSDLGDSGYEKILDQPAESLFQFYQVAYRNQSGTQFSLPQNPEQEDQLNELMAKLKGSLERFMINSQNPGEVHSIRKRLANIMYLFKNSDYQTEREVRIILKGDGFDKLGFLKINHNFTPPRVYLEVAPLTESLRRITIGPKATKPDEWGASLYYTFQRRGLSVEVHRSILPYR